MLGPEELSYGDLAAIVSEVVGRKVHYQHVPFEHLEAQMDERRANPAFARLRRHAARKGRGHGQRGPTHVRGHRPHDVPSVDAGRAEAGGERLTQSKVRAHEEFGHCRPFLAGHL